MNIEVEIKYKVKFFYFLMKEKRLALLKLFLSLFKNLEKALLNSKHLEELNKVFKNINKHINPEVWLSYYKSIRK
jgi:hypothetical protein